MIKSQSLLPPLIGLGIMIAYLTIFFMGIHILTIEPDEANILLSAAKLFNRIIDLPSAPDFPTLTNGGLYPLLHGALFILFPAIEWHRALSLFFCVLLILQFTFLIARYFDKTTAIFACCIFLACPGFLLTSSLAGAEIMATPTFMYALVLLRKLRDDRSWLRLGLVGLLLGLSCATRWSCFFLLPGIIIWQTMTFQTRKKNIFLGILVIVIGVASAGFFIWIYASFFPGYGAEMLLLDMLRPVGLSQDFFQRNSISAIVTRIVILEGFFPSLIIVISWFFLIRGWVKKNNKRSFSDIVSIHNLRYNRMAFLDHRGSNLSLAIFMASTALNIFR